MPAWNKGLTKETSASLLKTSATMRNRKLDNFKKWRDEMKREGKIKTAYPVFAHSQELAELIGVILGDGHIGVFPRSESLRIVGNSNNPGFISRYAKLVEGVFAKKPSVSKRKTANATDITIYEKHISKRLGIPAGARHSISFPTPRWILYDKKFLVAYLRGLYEAEGTYGIHLPTSTHKLVFCNANESMLNNVFEGLLLLGFHPHRSSRRVQVSKKEEVQKLKNLLRFRSY